MSYFANGGWHSATTLLAKATATLNNFSVSQQRSTDGSISDNATENTIPPGPQVDAPGHVVTWNYPPAQCTSKSLDAVASAAGRRGMFRSTARLRALPYLLRSTPATAILSVVPEEAERNVVSSSPLSSDAVADLHARVATRRPILSEEMSMLAEGRAADENSAGHEELSGIVGSSKPLDVKARISNSSLDGSPGTAEGPQIVSKGIEDELSEMRKKLNDATEQCTALHKRIHDLKRKNEEKAFQVKSVEGASALTVAKEELQDVVQGLETSIKEGDGLAEDCPIQNLRIEGAKQLLQKDHQKLTDATVQNEDLRHKLPLPSHAMTTGQLHASLDAAYTQIDAVSKVAEERAEEARRLQQLLSSLQMENQALKRKIEDQESRIQEMEEASDKERVDLYTAPSVEINTQRCLIQSPQTLRTKNEEVATLMYEDNGPQDQVGKLEVQCRIGDERNKCLEEDLAEANAAIQDLEEKEKIARKEKALYISQVDRLRQQLDDAQKLLVGRDERIRRLEDAKSDLVNALRRVQATVNAKELNIQGLQHQRTTLEGVKKSLEERVINLEKASVEAKDAAQNMLEKTVGDHRREILQTNNQIHGLRAAVRKLEAVIEEKNGLVEDLRSRNLANEEERQRLEKEIFEMEAEVGRTRHANQQALDQLTEDHHRKLTDATNTIQVLHDELSSSVATIAQLRASLDDSYTMTNEISKVAEDRAEEISRLQQFLSSLQEVNQALAQMVEGEESRLQ